MYAILQYFIYLCNIVAFRNMKKDRDLNKYQRFVCYLLNRSQTLRGLKRYEIADATGVNLSLVSGYTNGKRYPPLNYLFRLFEILDFDLSITLKDRKGKFQVTFELPKDDLISTARSVNTE